MSLNAWSYPFYDENPNEKRNTTLRKKITQPPKPSEPEDDLADFKPVMNRSQPLPPEEPPRMDDYPDDRTTLSERVNYVIQLLEDQKDEKTGRVAEEIVLYVFLGVFVIFVLDSFVKTGKYSR